MVIQINQNPENWRTLSIFFVHSENIYFKGSKNFRIAENVKFWRNSSPFPPDLSLHLQLNFLMILPLTLFLSILSSYEYMSKKQWINYKMLKTPQSVDLRGALFLKIHENVRKRQKCRKSERVIEENTEKIANFLSRLLATKCTFSRWTNFEQTCYMYPKS